MSIRRLIVFFLCCFIFFYLKVIVGVDYTQASLAGIFAYLMLTYIEPSVPPHA